MVASIINCANTNMASRGETVSSFGGVGVLSLFSFLRASWIWGYNLLQRLWVVKDNLSMINDLKCLLNFKLVNRVK